MRSIRNRQQHQQRQQTGIVPCDALTAEISLCSSGRAHSSRTIVLAVLATMLTWSVAVVNAFTGNVVTVGVSNGGSIHHRRPAWDSGAQESVMSVAALHASTAAEGDYGDEAFQRKNATRKKFGLSPLTRQQYDEVAVQIQALEQQQRDKASAMASSTSAESRRRAEQQGADRDSGQGLLSFRRNNNGMRSSNTCETNDDCERPQVCCDLVFRKMCCSTGMGIFDGNGSNGQRVKLIPAVVTVPVRPGDY